MKKRVYICLKEGIDKQEFVDSFDPETQADWWSMLESLPRLLVMDVEESFLDTFRSDQRIESIDEDVPDPVPASLTYENFVGEPITANTSGVDPLPINDDRNGTEFMPAHFYLNTDVIQEDGFTFGNANDDRNRYQDDIVYSTPYTGKNVDIVSLEVGPASSQYNNYDSHPDFSSGPVTNTRFVRMNWDGLIDDSNNQLNGRMRYSSHAIGVLSAAAGYYCGFAKDASIRVAYITANDTVTECIAAIVQWHNNKPVNPETGQRNPTIMIGEYQYLLTVKFAARISQIARIEYLDEVLTRPASGWNFQTLIDRNLIPFQVMDPITDQYEWCLTFPYQSRNDSLIEALNLAWNAGVVSIVAAGNSGGVYVKNQDPMRDGVRVITDNQNYSYDLINNPNVGNHSIARSRLRSSPTTYKPFIPFGPHGANKGIDVAASQNSETSPLLDNYSVRGPGIDIAGMGIGTFTAYPETQMADNLWGFFSGTSSATPTVVGVAACEMEKYFSLTGSWPTPDQVKEILINQSKDALTEVQPSTSFGTVNWNIPPSAFQELKVEPSDLVSASFRNYHRINSSTSRNGGVRLTQLAGTPNRRFFWNAKGFNRAQSQGTRPVTGAVYPRPKIIIKD